MFNSYLHVSSELQAQTGHHLAQMSSKLRARNTALILVDTHAQVYTRCQYICIIGCNCSAITLCSKCKLIRNHTNGGQMSCLEAVRAAFCVHVVSSWHHFTMQESPLASLPWKPSSTTLPMCSRTRVAPTTWSTGRGAGVAVIESLVYTYNTLYIVHWAYILNVYRHFVIHLISAFCATESSDIAGSNIDSDVILLIHLLLLHCFMQCVYCVRLICCLLQHSICRLLTACDAAKDSDHIVLVHNYK